MKKNLFYTLLPLLAVWIIANACSEKVEKTEYTHAIPANVTEMAIIDIKALVEKAGIASQSEALQQEFSQMLAGQLSTTLSEQVKSLLDNPEEAGIDWNAPFYLFEAPALHQPALAIKVSDLAKLEKLLQTLASEGLCTNAEKKENYQSVLICDAGTQLAFNDGTLLVVHAGSESAIQKLSPAVNDLMKQTKEKSIHANPHFVALATQKGDIRLLATPEALPMDVRGVLKWPHGTQLTGYLLFENGRIYAMLQQAGFEGETQESNQPFHPSNTRELQQAINSMMHGVPFNIELTSEELLTLSNLRVLMQFAPDSPEIQALYQTIMQIELLNVRGDNNRTTFTLVLTDKNQNALKQIIDFGYQLIKN